MQNAAIGRSREPSGTLEIWLVLSGSARRTYPFAPKTGRYNELDAPLDQLQLTFDPDLPISARRADIAAAVRDHQVVIVCGETGSGKSTQLPKICLEMGRGTAGLIGHTQPRRIAARSVAARIAEELGSPWAATWATRSASPKRSDRNAASS